MPVCWISIALQISPEHVILLSRRYSLLKLSQVVGMNLPAGLLLFCHSDLHFHPVHRTIIRSPHRPEDQRISGELWLLPSLQLAVDYQAADCQEKREASNNWRAE